MKNLFLFSIIFFFLIKSAFATPNHTDPHDLYAQAKENHSEFWAQQALLLDWIKPWEQTLEWHPPYAKWFKEGKLNACYNCLDRHITSERRYKTALLWEDENGKESKWSYEALYVEVNKFSNALKNLGIQKGDTVAIYMPMIPEAVVAMLSCARIGAVHTVIFSGFSANALKDRIQDAEAKVLITADGSIRKGKVISLKEAAEYAVRQCPSIQHTIVVKHMNAPVSMQAPKDLWYHQLIEESASECPCEVMDAEDPLFILYTSGTTGKPKGIVHSTGGYMVGVTATTQWVFDIQEEDTYFTTADIGWITGHSYLVYGPLSNGMTQLIYEGSLDSPQKNRLWQLIDKYKVTTLYTAPTAIRTFMQWGESWLNDFDLSSLRLLGSVGEPLNTEAWQWYHTYVGREKCPIVDTWWQTETGCIMITSIPYFLQTKPGSAGIPLPGIDASIIDEEGNFSMSGNLVIKKPWPSMLRGIHKDPKRYEQTYWGKWKNSYYYTGDGASVDDEGYYRLNGRVDDVINVSGHRLGTMELESALASYSGVVEAAAVAISHPVKGQAIIAFAVLKSTHQQNKNMENALKQHVVHMIGAIARPEKIIFVRELPKTRSGKIMRRLLKDIAEGRTQGDTMTLVNPEVLLEIETQLKQSSLMTK